MAYCIEISETFNSGVGTPEATPATPQVPGKSFSVGGTSQKLTFFLVDGFHADTIYSENIRGRYIYFKVARSQLILYAQYDSNAGIALVLPRPVVFVAVVIS